MSNKFRLLIAMSLFSFTIQSNSQPSINRKLWGKVDEKDVWLYTLRNAKGITVEITNYGGIVKSIFAPDRNGEFENIVLGFDSLGQYRRQNSPFMGAIIGRYANRISGDGFKLDGIQYKLFPNDYPNHSHGGKKGFDKVVWDPSEIKEADAVGVKLLYLSKDNEEGYPGNLTVWVSYILSNDNELRINYEAKTDKKTVVNLTHHSYFNLGACKENILDHQLAIFADYITPTDEKWIPTGILAPVAGTDFDFTVPRKVGERIHNLPFGYNMNYVVRKATENELSKTAEVFDAKSGRFMEVFSTEPGLQLYTADYLNGKIVGSGNIVLSKNMGLCLETQHFPDSPNKPAFPTTVLKPGETYTQTTIYKFSTRK